jgi:hypothetical protein
MLGVQISTRCLLGVFLFVCRLRLHQEAQRFFEVKTVVHITFIACLNRLERGGFLKGV